MYVHTCMFVGCSLAVCGYFRISFLRLLLTYSMVQSPSWEANWFAASQGIPRILWNPKVHYRTHKRPPPVPILDQPNPVHIPTSHLLEIHPNIIHPSMPRSPQWFLRLFCVKNVIGKWLQFSTYSELQMFRTVVQVHMREQAWVFSNRPVWCDMEEAWCVKIRDKTATIFVTSSTANFSKVFNRLFPCITYTACYSIDIVQ